MEEYLFSGGGQTGGNTGGITLGNTGLKGAVGIVFEKLLRIDAAGQVTVHIANGLVLGHHFVQGQGQRVAAGAGVLFMLSNQFYAHLSHPPQAFSMAFKAFSEAAMASAHCSSLGWEEWSCFGSAKVAPLPLQVSSTIQLGTPFFA